MLKINEEENKIVSKPNGIFSMKTLTKNKETTFIQILDILSFIIENFFYNSNKNITLKLSLSLPNYVKHLCTIPLRKH